VLGRDIHSLTGQDKVRFRGEHFGFVFQQHHLLPSLNAKENCAIPSVINGASRKNATEAACELLQQVGLGHRIDADPATLSGGEQQRVAVARALVHEPRLVMCDEPTASLDAESGKQVMQLLRGVAVSEDRAVIVVTHDQRLFDFADRLGRMDDGRIVSVE